MKKFLRRERKWPISHSNSQSPKAFNQTLALQTLKQHQNPQTLLSDLIDSFTSHGCDPTPEAYGFVVGALIGASCFDAVAPVLDRIESVEKFETPERFFRPIIGFYGLTGRFGDALELFCRIPKFRCVPSSHSLNSLLYVFCQRPEGLRFVPEVLIKSKLMNIRLEGSSFRILISALCRIGKVLNAIEVLNCMISDGYDLDLRVCSLVLSSVCERNEELGWDGLKVLGLLEGMKRSGFCPGVGDYSKVIGVLVKERRGLEALKVLGIIKGDGIKPDIVCYTKVLDGLALEKEYEKADKLFDELLVLGLVPNVRTYNAYINGLCERDDVEGGFNMISYMSELGCEPNFSTYSIVLKVLCKNGEVGRAKELLSVMILKGIATSSWAYKIMLDSVFGKGDVVEASVLMEEMLDKGLCCGCSMYDEIIIGLCRRGMVCKALEMLEKMAGQNVAPGIKAWESLLLSTGSELTFPNYDTWIGLVNHIETSPTLDNDLKASIFEEK